MSKDQIVKFLKNPLWIVVILLFVMLFQIYRLNKGISSLDGYLFDIQQDLRGISEALGEPSRGIIMTEGVNERLVEILDKLDQILYKLRQ